MDESNKLDISKQKKDFREHLDIADNHRIFFSGIFGSGKTYMLKEFFQEFGKDYYCIHLYPVNYQLGSNADIFEYIKYDILLNLLVDEEFRKALTGKKLERLAISLGKEGFKKLIDFAKLDPRIHALASGINKLTELYESIKSNNQLDDVESYLKTVEAEPGIYEKSSIIDLISEAISNIMPTTVLIIDDLDRVDPKHLFRLLNIFAAHQDIEESRNKFSFDKIVLVGDYYNTKNIFHTLYGLNTDFIGYIDKFFSRDVFHYENKQALAQALLKFTNSVKGLDLSSNNHLYMLAFFVLLHLIALGKFSTRNLIHYQKIVNSLVEARESADYSFTQLLLRIYSREELLNILDSVSEVHVKEVIKYLGRYDIGQIMTLILDQVAEKTSDEYEYVDDRLGINANTNSARITNRIPHKSTQVIPKYKDFLAILESLF